MALKFAQCGGSLTTFSRVQIMFTQSVQLATLRDKNLRYLIAHSYIDNQRNRLETQAKPLMTTVTRPLI